MKSKVGLEGEKARIERFIRDVKGTLLRDRMRIRERWARFYHTFWNTKSLTLSPTIIDLLPPRPLEESLRDEPSMDEMTDVIKGMSNWKAVGPDGVPSELPILDHPEFVQYPNSSSASTASLPMYR